MIKNLLGIIAVLSGLIFVSPAQAAPVSYVQIATMTRTQSGGFHTSTGTVDIFTIGTKALAATGSGGSPSYTFTNFQTTGWFAEAGPGLTAAVGTTPIAEFLSTGFLPKNDNLFSCGTTGNAWANVQSYLFTGSTFAASSAFWAPNGTAAKPGFAFSNSHGSGLFYDPNTAFTYLEANGDSGSSLIISTSGISFNTNQSNVSVGINGTVAGGDLGLQIANGALDGAGFVSASSGRTSAILAAFGPTYVGTRSGVPAADLAVVEFGGTNSSGAALVTNTNVPMYFGVNQALAVTIATGTKKVTLVGGIASGDFVTGTYATFTGSGTFSNAVIATTGTFSQSITASSATFNGTIVATTATFTGQLIGKGTVSANNAATGYIGEYISTVTANYVPAIGSGFGNDYVNLTLTAGDWDISMCLDFAANGATVTNADGWIGTTSGNNTNGRTSGDTDAQVTPGPTAAGDVTVCVPNVRKNISATTTYYLKSIMTYSIATPNGYGRMSARRIR